MVAVQESHADVMAVREPWKCLQHADQLAQRRLRRRLDVRQGVLLLAHDGNRGLRTILKAHLERRVLYSFVVDDPLNAKVPGFDHRFGFWILTEAQDNALEIPFGNCVKDAFLDPVNDMLALIIAVWTTKRFAVKAIDVAIFEIVLSETVASVQNPEAIRACRSQPPFMLRARTFDSVSRRVCSLRHVEAEKVSHQYVTGRLIGDDLLLGDRAHGC